MNVAEKPDSRQDGWVRVSRGSRRSVRLLRRGARKEEKGSRDAHLHWDSAQQDDQRTCMPKGAMKRKIQRTSDSGVSRAMFKGWASG